MTEEWPVLLLLGNPVNKGVSVACMWVAGQGTRWWGVHINGEQGGAHMIKIRQKRNWVSFVAANWRYGSVILSDPRHVLDVLHRIGSKELDGWESESVTHLALNHFLLACHFKFWFKQWGFPLPRTASAAYLVLFFHGFMSYLAWWMGNSTCS